MPILAFKMPARVASRSRASTKGRGGRKGGPDRRSSGPERRRELKPQNYKTTPAIKAWRPPVPEPLPPAPLLGPKELLALGLLVGAQVWAWLNSRPTRSKPLQYVPGLNISGTYPPPGNTVGATVTIVQGPASYQVFGWANNACVDGTTGTTTGGTITKTGIVAVEPYSTAGPCGKKDLGWKFTYTSGFVENAVTKTTGGFGVKFWNASDSISWDHPTAIPYPGEENIPLPNGYVAPQVVPTVHPDKLLPPPPLPLPAPSTVPQVEPEVQPEVAPVEPGVKRKHSGVITKTTSWVNVPKIATSVSIKNGALPAPTPAPVPTTDPGSIIPWPGAAPIPGSGPAPAPTLDGIAQEVGRIERKLEMMNTPNAPGNLVDRFGNLAELIGPIIEAIQALSAETTYELDSPCEIDEETGEKLPPVVVQVPGAITQFGAILNRVDALAELLQVHKNLKQPNCKPKQPQGEFVTVNFEQIDPWPENDL
jgi:hypothetical protein